MEINVLSSSCRVIVLRRLGQPSMLGSVECQANVEGCLCVRAGNSNVVSYIILTNETWNHA